MRKKLQNLLAAAIMLVAGSVGAMADTDDVTTQANIDFSSDITDGVVTGTVGTMTISNYSGTNPASVSDGQLVLGKSDNTVTLSNASRENYSKDVVTFSFDMSFGNLYNRQEYVYIRDASGSDIAYFKYGRYSGTIDTNLGLTTSSFTGQGNSSYPHGQLVPIEIVLDYKNATITTTINSGDAVVATMTNSNPAATFMVGSNYDNSDRFGYFDDLVITTTEGDYTTESATYTINYVDENSNTVFTTTATGDVGETITLTAAQTASFYSEDGETRYNYSSDDGASTTLTSDGATVTVNVTSESKVTYTFNTSVGTYSYTGTEFLGNTVSVPFPKYQLVDGTLYSTSNNSSSYYYESYTLTEDNQTYTKTYSVDTENVVYYSEAEDIEGMTSVTTGNANIRCSMGTGAYNAGSDDITATTLEPGAYTITAQVWGNAAQHLIIQAGNDSIHIATTGSLRTRTLDVVLSEKTAVTLLTSGNGGNSPHILDYIYIQKTGDAYVTKTLGASRYGTFSAAFNATVPDGITVYSAATSTVDDETVLEITAIDDIAVIPANTGVVIKGTAGETYTFDESSETAGTVPSTNKMVAHVSAGEAESGWYGLLLADESAALMEEGTTLAANTAYFTLDSSAKSLRIVTAGEATAIAEVEAVTADSDAACYNVLGQRVNASAKGIVIKNGKKYVNK